MSAWRHEPPFTDLQKDDVHPRWDWAASNGMDELQNSMKGTDTMKAEIVFANLRFDLHPEASSSDLEIAASQRRGIVLHLRNRP